MGGSIRVAVVDDHPLYREGIIATLKREDDFLIVGQGSCAEDAVRVVRDEKPDIALLDINMPGDGLVAARRLLEAGATSKIVLLTVSEDAQLVSSAMQSGVCGYIVKGVTGPELAGIIREIHGGARYVSPALAARILSQQAAAMVVPKPNNLLSSLTHREAQVIVQVARGLTNKEVARVLTLNEKTVKHYMTSIMQKLQARNRTEVVLIASASKINAGQGGLVDRAEHKA
jgi:two-component system, NarL family, nitrate/nitrite response regulator NarL